MSASPLSLLPSTVNLGDGECPCSAEGDCSFPCPSRARLPAASRRVLCPVGWPRCIAVASTCMLAVQFSLLVAFFLLPSVKSPTPSPPTDEGTHRFHNCHQPEEKNRLRRCLRVTSNAGALKVAVLLDLPLLRFLFYQPSLKGGAVKHGTPRSPIQLRRYVPDHLLHSNRSRDVDPSEVPIFCVFRNSVYWKFKKVRYRLGTVPHSLCTHLLYHSAKYSSGAIVSRETLFDEIYQGFTIAANMRRIWRHLRVLLTLFVSKPETAEFSESIQSGRDVIFGEAAYRWLTSHKFDGLNLDWPYAGGPCGSSSDVSRYTALLRSLKTRFQSRFMLTVTVPGELEDVSKGLDLLAASEVSDFLLLRSQRRRNLDPFQYDCPGHAVAPVFFALKALAPNAKICISISFEVGARISV
ncbi:hypothetical protein HPB50_017481 [Hyalomma asiaticum]|uniref:Uncharacterized protein n=1 Tax=Hyalomma asiaticum TaxID=266040 RepID=A0ACB7S793_HYAAI|nr:hypothetical protein HPB50_017481 [Hyalomma asiaticum]